jgi:tetratricopeptide (TPR) repeat protein
LEDRAPQDSAEYIRALLKLGQWQRDRSHFDLARTNLTRAIELARKGKAINREEMSEFYNSYADFLRQVGNQTEAARYEQMSRELNPKHSRK